MNSYYIWTRDVISQKLKDYIGEENFDKNQPWFSDEGKKQIIKNIVDELDNKPMNEKEYKNLVCNRILLGGNKLYYEKNIKYRILGTFPGNKTLLYSEILNDYIKKGVNGTTFLKKINELLKEIKEIDLYKNEIEEIIKEGRNCLSRGCSLYYCDNDMRNILGEYIRNNTYSGLTKSIYNEIENINGKLNVNFEDYYNLQGKIKNKVLEDDDLCCSLITLYLKQFIFCGISGIGFFDGTHICFCDLKSSTDKGNDEKGSRLGIYRNDIGDLNGQDITIIINHATYEADIDKFELKALYFKDNNYKKLFRDRKKDYEKIKEELEKDFNNKILSTDILLGEIKKNNSKICRYKRIDSNGKRMYIRDSGNELKHYFQRFDCELENGNNKIKIQYTGSTSGSGNGYKLMTLDHYNLLFS